MNEVDLSNFDKLLLELVFQNEQEAQNKRNTKELIQCYRAKFLHEKQQVLALKKDISLSDEIILDLQKYNRNNSDRLVTCTSTPVVFEREEEFLQIQMENAINTTENDKKTYQDSMEKCKATLKQHEEKYMEFAFAKAYHELKGELDSILKVTLTFDEQLKMKDKIILDIMEPALFGSHIDWSLKLANLRKNTSETIHHISQTSNATSEIMQKIDELDRKIKYIDEQTKNISEKENETEEDNNNQTTEFQQGYFNEEGTRLSQSKEKRSNLLHLLDLQQRLMRPHREKKLHFSETGTDNSGKVDEPQNSNSIVSSQDSCVETDSQEPLINNKSNGFILPTTNLQHQGQLRLGLIQKQIHSKLDVKETEVRRQQFTEVPDTSKDSGYVVQGNSVSYEDMDCKADGETSPNEVFALPRISSPFIIPDPLSTSTNTSIRKCESNKGKKSQNFTESAIDLRNFNEEGTRLSQSKEKRSNLLHLPDLQQRLMRPHREKKLHFSETGTDNSGKVDEPKNSNSIVSNQDSCVEMDSQEPLINNESNGFIPPTTNLQHQGQLRLGPIQNEIHSKLDNKETEVRRQQFIEVPDTSKDSGYVSQGNSVSYEDMDCKADGETSPNEVFALPRIPSTFIIPDPPSTSTNTSIRKCERNKGKKSQNFTKSAIDLFSKTEQTESPCLNLFKTSTPKTPNLCSFESFATVRFQDQQESFSAADTNPTSPAKDIGNLFQNMEGDDDFAFLFASKSSQASDDDKDDFSFMLPFGQDAGNSMEFEPAQSKTKFSFF